MLRGVLVTGLLLVLVVFGTARVEAADPAEVRQIASRFWVPGSFVRMTADRSELEAARALRAEIAMLLDAGLSAEEIHHLILERYGSSLLASPRARGFGIVAWLMPGVAVGIGLVLLIYRLRRWVLNYRFRRNKRGAHNSEVYES